MQTTTQKLRQRYTEKKAARKKRQEKKGPYPISPSNIKAFLADDRFMQNNHQR